MDELDKSQFYGRLVKVPQNYKESFAVKKYASIEIFDKKIKCRRCGQKSNKADGQLPGDNFYCRKCINLGRIDTLSELATIEEPNLFSVELSQLKWQGKLTKSQSRCSEEIIESIEQLEDRLLWAVTGAGKTEMLFKPIDSALKQGKRVGIATPRVDVCNELHPRIQKVFPNLKIPLLHGSSDDYYSYQQLTIMTTHQLLRFYHAFDVLIIDEVDAFPFAMNPQLIFAAKQACKLQGSTIYLTATPDGKLLKDSKQKRLATSYLPRRFHGQVLPKISLKYDAKWSERLEKGRLSKHLKLFLRIQLQAKRNFLVFVPQIRLLAILKQTIIEAFPDLKILTVHSEDTNRIKKVQKMRDGEIQGLITTTILERGVTFPGIDVLILGADDPVFSMAALVQIAGRVGRSPQRPDGNVWAVCQKKNRNLKRAQNQINFMNRKEVL